MRCRTWDFRSHRLASFLADGIVAGCNSNGSEPFGGDIAEILVYNHALDAEARAQNAYYARRWYNIK